MSIRIAILAACAGTLVLAQADIARANYSAAFEPTSPVRITDVGPEAIVLAQSAPVNTSRSNKKAGKTAEGGSARGQVATTRGRKVHPGKTGKGAIFDRGQEIPMTSY